MSTSSSSRKRKHPSKPVKQRITFPESKEHQDPDPALFIQAYEATIIRGPHAKAAAQSLEVFNYDEPPNEKGLTPAVGEALIRWGGSVPPAASFSTDEDEDDSIHGVNSHLPAELPPVWVDRYDVRLLLDAVPLPSSAPAVPPDSPTGWSDLPSDSEDMFFFSPDEADDFRREKRRRLIERTREDRLKARMLEDGVDEEVEEDVWGGSDEEPDEGQKELMTRTAKQLLASSNPAQLEMRVLANYGGDKRFAFLRGRWSRSWKLTKHKARVEQEQKEREKKQGVGLGLLTGYGSGDSDEDDKEEETHDEGKEKAKSETTTAVVAQDPEEAAKELRRLKAKEWAEKRRAMKKAENI